MTNSTTHTLPTSCILTAPLGELAIRLREALNDTDLRNGTVDLAAKIHLHSQSTHSSQSQLHPPQLKKQPHSTKSA
ncbi:hypothetical protein BDW59DRAFT_152699 [Aspergillus cavernicola]|uniref:Uncharacterized protein n=1 Tax=Aspergillus cavernicola TaxID=176166 RepID=A0ABR4HPQ2_9EURO